MLFSTKSIAVLTLAFLAVAKPVTGELPTAYGADCYANAGCTASSPVLLHRDNDCTLPPASELPYVDGITPGWIPAWSMGVGPEFCGNRKSFTSLEKATQFCFDIGASSACEWGKCNPKDVGYKCYTPGGGTFGDPHVKTWFGEEYDYHGECDLVLADVPSKNLTVHVRTTIRYDYSYISSAVVRLNGETMEVGSWGTVVVNGVYVEGNTQLPASIGGHSLTTVVSNKKHHVFQIDLSNGNNVELKTFKDMVAVKLNGGHTYYKDSSGLMGSASNGSKIGRDGKTVFEDNDAFGQEWQVLESEDMLFETAREPQLPSQQCRMPDKAAKASLARRLGESKARAQAEAACASWGMNKAACVNDVMATGDLEFALGGAF